MIQVNGRTYADANRPVVGICLDGSAQEYLDAAAGVMPNLQAILARGHHGIATSVVPSYTNPNNMSIVTGVPPAIHGVAGNYYYDAAVDREVMMDDPRFLRATTILAAFSAAGKKVAAITTKDKLRRFLATGLDGICFSVEKADVASQHENGISDVLGLVGRQNPGVYDPEASVFCLEAGAALLARQAYDLMYLSTTDYVQHKYTPGTPESNAFYARLDLFIGAIDAQNVVLGITADHGMNAKVDASGAPNVLYVETILREQGIDEARVILPITDPYVVHHGALGSYATVYLATENVEPAILILRALPGVESVHTRAEAAGRFSLPPDRIGDLVVLSDRDTVLGRTAEWHDLSNVATGLRSHGGLHETQVPFVVNRPLRRGYADRLESGAAKNYDLFDFLLNGVMAEPQ